MNSRAEGRESSGDSLKMVLAGLVLVASLGAFYWFSDVLLVFRTLGLLLGLVLALFIASRTEPGRRVLAYLADARMEVRKVVWPSRQETLQTAVAVFVMVVAMGLILWLFDILMLTAVRWITGQGA